MCYEKLKNQWKKNSKILKMLWYILLKTMETYSICFKKNTPNKNSSVRKTKHNRLKFVSNCAAYCKKQWRFIKNQEVSTLVWKESC